MSLSILLVEDETEIRNTIIEELRSNDIFDNVLQAADPLSALEIFNHNKDQISVVICDHYLPVQNGSELCDIIKKERPGIKIIMFTADPGLKDNINTSNIDLILLKPEGLFELAFAVKKI